MAELEIEESAGALRLTLCRPPVNVLDIGTLRRLHEALPPSVAPEGRIAAPDFAASSTAPGFAW